MFELKIDTSNATFNAEANGFPPESQQMVETMEIKHIMDRIIRSMYQFEIEGKCIDTNGNIVGKWKLS